MREVKLVFVGFGTVAQGCARHLLRNRSFLKEQRGFTYKVVGITDTVKGSVQNNEQSSKRIKLLASAVRSQHEGVAASVKPTLIPQTDILAHVSGVMNALQIATDVQPDITIMDPGAGGDSAGYGLLNDILSINRL